MADDPDGDMPAAESDSPEAAYMVSRQSYEWQRHEHRVGQTAHRNVNETAGTVGFEAFQGNAPARPGQPMFYQHWRVSSTSGGGPQPGDHAAGGAFHTGSSVPGIGAISRGSSGSA